MIKLKFLYQKINKRIRNRKSKLDILYLFKDEKGFSTLSIVVAMLLSLSLIFSTAQVYKIYSASSDIQNVSDSCCLSAQNQVAEFMILVRVSDSTILSLGLASIITAGIGTVAMCIPFGASIGDSLLDFAEKLLNARESFANKSAKTLNTIQKSLPFISSVKAYQLASSNNSNLFKADYLSFVLLMPGKGIEITPGNIDNVKNSLNDIKNQSAELKNAAKIAEEATIKANESKLKAFNADCGNNPNYCMYERAKNKANMSGSENPLYKNIDNWNFEIALNRAKAYYPKRYSIEKPESESVEEISNCELRKIYYKYADKTLKNAYIIDTDEKFEAYFPHLFKNTSEMKESEVYTNEQFPVTKNNEIKTMHAYSNCPACINVCSYETLISLETGNWEECAYCKFNASSMGKVAAASSSIDNGFEYHYCIVENAVKDFQNVINEAKPATNKVKNISTNIFSKIKEIIKSIFNKRIDATPPGAYGTIAITINKGSAPASNGFESTFVKSSSVIGTRAAISAATMIEEDSLEGKNLLTSITTNIINKLPSISGIASLALNTWSKLLNIYNESQEYIVKNINTVLSQIPLSSVTGLGNWASNKFTNFISECGFQPANLKALKPVLINSSYVANKEKNSSLDINDSITKNFAVKYLNIKEYALKNEKVKNDILSGISNTTEMANLLNLSEAISTNGQLEIAIIEPLGNTGPKVPIYIKLPKFATDTMSNIISILTNTLQSISERVWDGKIWK